MIRDILRACVYPWWFMSLGLVFAQWIVPGSVAVIGNPAYWLLGTSALLLAVAPHSRSSMRWWSYGAGVLAVIGWLVLVLGPWLISAQDLWRGWVVVSAVVGVFVTIATLHEADVA